ncbi:MAG: ABC transporter ATP-binding protein [Planctomycetia bacterium]|nr:MAG: ABC transporter ATP-binding protein [Planctomycetia bacterium]
MSVSAIIRVVGLSKTYLDFWRRARVRAVVDVDLAVEPGEIFGLLGPNGSGKSTTIKMILGLLHPTRGTVSVFGRPASDVRTKARIGYLPEESYSYRFLNARETLHYYGTLFQISRKERVRRIEELLDMVGLRGAARRPVGEYSKGMARRIGLAQALINDPDLLILDEPTSGLDPIGAKLVKDIIVRLGHELRKTILLSSHLLADVEEVCSRVTILYGGRVQVAGTMQEVLSRRDMIQLTCERLRPETLAEIQRLIEQREGKSVSVSVPLDRLEALFLRIVEEARRAQVETHGSQAAGDVAGFLGGADGGRAVLDSLLRAEPVDRPAPSQAAPSTDRDVLEQLQRADSKPAAPPEPRAAPGAVSPAALPKQNDADRGLLDDLAGGDRR